MANNYEARFKVCINDWDNYLSDYTLEELKQSPEQGTWSMGQLYMHLIESSDRMIKRAENCLNSNENSAVAINSSAEKIFNTGIISEQKIKAPTHVTNPPEQPVNKEFISDALKKLSHDFSALVAKSKQFNKGGKLPHPNPNLGMFNAEQWMDFSILHFNHHLKQKNQLDVFLSKKK
ncbi:MAG: DinB family protein [Bacteroidetes bacterium]|nr:DinB family protein [Bacteroidota bacterium]